MVKQYRLWKYDPVHKKPKSTRRRHERIAAAKVLEIPVNQASVEDKEECAVEHQNLGLEEDTCIEMDPLTFQPELTEGQEMQGNENVGELEPLAEPWIEDIHMGDPAASNYCAAESASSECVNSFNIPLKEDVLFEETLCPCTSMTAGDVLLMTLSLGLRHNLTWSAQVDILKMVNKLFKFEPVPATKFLYEKHVCKGDIAVDTYWYCPECGVSLGKVNPQSENIVCECKTSISSKSSLVYMSLSLEDQFKNIFKDSVVAESLKSHRFNRVKYEKDSFEDIFDGAAYQKLFQNGGPLSNPNNFSVSFNTDGVSAGKSNSVNKTMWPILVTINELPYSLRNKYVLLAGLYVGKKHPHMNSFLEPFVEQLNKLSSEGFKWEHSTNEIVSRVFPLCAVVDSPARCAMLRINSFTSLYGCTFCFQRTVRTHAGRRFAGTDYAALRSHESIKDDMDTALKNLGQSEPRCRGVWEPSVLKELNFFDMGKGFVPDYLHALLLGCVKQHTELLLVPSTKKKFWIHLDVTEDIGIDHVIAIVDKVIETIVVPHCITRLPRGLSVRDNWKASEWRSWLLFYCIVCLEGLLKPKYLRHLALLCTAIQILLQRSISSDQLNLANDLILEYVILYEEYFGDVKMNYCIHLLTHFVDGVKNYGPLFTHNTFLYEGQNRFLLQLLKSPNRVAQQLSKKYITFACLPELCTKLASDETSAEFVGSILSRCLKSCVRLGSTVLVGKGMHYTLTEVETLCLESNNIVTEGTIKTFERFLYKGSRYSTEAYAKGKRNNDSIIYTVDKKFFFIEKILLISANQTFILGRQFSCNSFLRNKDPNVFHICSLEEISGSLSIVDPRNILCQCIFIKDKILCQMPFGCFGD